MSAPPFTLDGYRALIAAILDKGYMVRGFQDAEPDRPHLILRHDVDMDLGRAVAMAEVEGALGIRATYFVLLRTEFYNVFAASSRAALRRLLALGHSVGLHFDASLHPADAEALDLAAGLEAEALALALDGVRPSTVSFHRPAQGLIGGRDTVGGMLSAYALRFIRDMAYCSDSRGGWHHGSPLAHPALAERRALQLLTHPIWWVGDDLVPAVRLDRFLAERTSMLDEELARNCLVHVPASQR